MNPPEGTVKVLMTPEVVEAMWSRDHRGRRVTIDWGEPDEAGFHVPTMSVALDDPSAQDMADGEALRRLREALPGSHLQRVTWRPLHREKYQQPTFEVRVEWFVDGDLYVDDGYADTIAEAAAAVTKAVA